MPEARARDYFRRLRTFRDASKWFDKPIASVRAPACARRGWRLAARELLRYETCEALLAYPSSGGRCGGDGGGDAAMEEAMARDVEKMLVDTHERGCAWRETGTVTSARGFPAPEETSTTRGEFARRVDAVRKGGGDVPVCVVRWDGLNVNASLRAGAGLSRGTTTSTDETDVRSRVVTLTKEARTHAEEEEEEEERKGATMTLTGDLTPLERRSIVDYAMQLALFGWSPTRVDAGPKGECRRVYACALCGVRAPEWTFTSVTGARVPLVASSTARQSSGAKRTKTTVATLRGAAGGAYGMNIGASSWSAERVPFAPVIHEKAQDVDNCDQAESATKKTSIHWVAATANVAAKLAMSIGSGGGAAGGAVANAAPFGAASSAPSALFGSPRPVTMAESPLESSSAVVTGSPLDGSKFASVVVAAVTKARSIKKRRAVALDEDATLKIPPTAVLFDVVAEHHDYCPWVCDQIDGRDVIPGWRATLDVLVPSNSSRDATNKREKNFTVVDYARAREMVAKYLA